MRTDTLASSLTINIRTESLETGAVPTSTVTGDLTRSVVYNGYDYSLPVTIKCHLCEDGQISADPHGYGHVPAGTTFECARCNGTGLVIRHGAYVEYDPPQVTMWHAGSRKLTIQNGQGEDTNVTWPTDRHWLGDSLFSATRVSRRRVPCPNHEPGRMADGTLSNVCEHCHGAMSNNRGRGSVEVVTRRRMRFLSSFDYNERAPLYFLAALPRKSRATTVDMATDDLAPAAVHAAYARGLAVIRQGDIFGIPTPLTDADVYARSVKRTRLYMWSHPNGKPRPGEVGYRRPMSPAAAQARTAAIRRDTLAAMHADMSADARPSTP